MTDKFGNYDEYNNDGGESAIVPIQPIGGDSLDQWTGGVNYVEEIARLPERLEWDKKTGEWKCESFVSDKLVGCHLIAATTLWAIWSERVGQPLDLQVGPRPQGLGYDMGLRLILEYDDYLYYWDCFGVTFKSAQSAVRRFKAIGLISWVDKKQINTKFGPFYVPALEPLSEGE